MFPRLKERRRNLGYQLSGGEQQMLTTARTILGRPSVLLLDEPLEGLAPVICDELMAAFDQARLDRRHDHRSGRAAHPEPPSISPTRSSSSSAAGLPGREHLMSCVVRQISWKSCWV